MILVVSYVIAFPISWREQEFVNWMKETTEKCKQDWSHKENEE